MSTSIATRRTLDLDFTSDLCALFSLGKGLHLSAHLPSHTPHPLLLRATRSSGMGDKSVLLCPCSPWQGWSEGAARASGAGGQEAGPTLRVTHLHCHSNSWLGPAPAHLKLSDPNHKKPPWAPCSLSQPTSHSGGKAHGSHAWPKVKSRQGWHAEGSMQGRKGIPQRLKKSPLRAPTFMGLFQGPQGALVFNIFLEEIPSTGVSFHPFKTWLHAWLMPLTINNAK